ncbi:MlaD family protein [Methylococcus sp. EFPC2]|uniref:MlaD family protein n=1 Tax=Methylococcus sp. EFPC2 TaxID=2812648 RepID=UPI0019675BDF|nr:hypothetical protein [Methylococcus sp. EFPC2]QSA98783.1 hypothetical protein JWZ97_08370 [Methylococcus sp. EFPC2]
MFRLSIFVVLLLAILSGCSRDLNFKIHFERADGLVAGAPLVMQNQVVGEVIRIEPAADGGILVSVSVERPQVATVTEDSRFYVEDDPAHPPGKRIEIVQTRPGGKPIPEGSVVQGSSSRLRDWFPLNDIIKEFGGILRGLRDQVEQFSREMDALPKSEQAKDLRSEWLKLMEEIKKAQSSAEESLKEEVLPQLQQEMENLRKRLDELKREPPRKLKPLET